jgi:hypothetical protein
MTAAKSRRRGQPPRVVRRGRAALKLVETAPLLLDGFGQEAGDTDSALTLAREAADLLEPRLEDAGDEICGLYGALQLHAATTAAPGRSRG